jgi:hypothetical protein
LTTVCSWLELQTSGELDGTRSANSAIPGSEVALCYVCVKGHGRAAIIATLRSDQIVVVECVEEIGRELEGRFFCDAEVLGQGDVEVLVCRAVKRSDRIAGSGVAEAVELRSRLERTQVEVLCPGAGVEAVASVQLRKLARYLTRDAAFAEVRRVE